VPGHLRIRASACQGQVCVATLELSVTRLGQSRWPLRAGWPEWKALPMAYAKTSERREKRLLREQMRSMGLGYRDIAAEFARRYRLRPRAAWRDAYGWSLQDTADRINEFRGNTGLDPGGIASMTAPHLSEYERWPGHGPEPAGALTISTGRPVISVQQRASEFVRDVIDRWGDIPQSRTIRDAITVLSE
jgi:hypothetical protein